MVSDLKKKKICPRRTLVTHLSRHRKKKTIFFTCVPVPATSVSQPQIVEVGKTFKMEPNHPFYRLGRGGPSASRIRKI